MLMIGYLSLPIRYKRPITYIKRHFCLRRNPTNAHNPRK